MKKITLLLSVLLIANIMFAQDRGFKKVRVVAKDHVALIIGNSNYPDMPLENPKNDADAVAKEFEEMGFIVEKVIDTDKEQMSMAIDRFSAKLKTAKVAVFYFAGHGMQVDGENYLIPIGKTAGTQISNEEQVAYRAINAGEVLSAMESENIKFSLIVLDACRNNPIKGESRGKMKGLASIDAPAGSLVMYATKAGDVAEDGTGNNSPFTTAFLQHISTPGLDINLLPSRVTKTVNELTDGRQTPGSYVQITQSFTFVPEYTTAELEQIKKQQQGKLTELQQKEVEIQKQKDKEDAEMLRKQAEIDALEKQIADMKNNTGGETDLDKMIEIIEQKETQKAELLAMQQKAREERIIREKEIADMKQKKFDENIEKYNKIANSEFGQEMKETAWNSVLRNLGLAQGSVAVGDENALYMNFFDILTFIDQRDGKTYKIVEIGDQVWMAENLAYKANSGCWAYDDNNSNVAKYGYLYNFETAQNVCPSGYHLPSDNEWEELAEYINSAYGTFTKSDDKWQDMGKLLKATSGWAYYKGKSGNGTDNYGFSALPGGPRNNNGSFGYIGGYGYWWSSTTLSSSKAWCRSLYCFSASFDRSDRLQGSGFSVRCVQN